MNSENYSSISGPPSNNMGVTSADLAPWKDKSNSEDDRQVTECSFDWYQCTFPGDPRLPHQAYARQTVEKLCDHLKPFKVRQIDKGLHGYRARTELVDHRGAIELTILHGGNPRPNCRATSVRAAPFAELMRNIEPGHKVTRVDSALDFAGEGAWDAALATCRGVMEARNMDSGRIMQPDSPTKGATFYMGSSQSTTMARLYQKGYEQLKRFPDCGADPDWVRLELQVRPQKAGKATFANLSAGQVWGSSLWCRELIRAFTAGAFKPEAVRAAPRTETEWERTERYLSSQYSRHMFDGAKMLRDRTISPGKSTSWREGLRLYMGELHDQVQSIIEEKIRAGIWLAEDRDTYTVNAPAILNFGGCA